MSTSPAVRAALLLAGCADRRALVRERARAAIADANLDELAAELTGRRLLPLLGTRILEIGADLVTPAFERAVEQAVVLTRAKGLAAEAAARSLVPALRQAGIDALPLKGPFLALDAHGDVGMREFGDIDLLVEQDQLEPAVRVLSRGSYSALPEPLGRDGLPSLHVRMRGQAPDVELHWRIHWYETAFSRDMLARAGPGPGGVLRPRADDLAASLLLFYARDGFHGVRLAADLAAWWDRHGRDLPAGFLETHARRYPALRRALSAAAIVVERVAGVPALAWLGAGASIDRRVAVAARLSSWTQTGDREQLSANMSLVGGLLGPAGSMREFARRELIAPTPGALARVEHAAKMATRYGIALWAVRGGGSWEDETLASAP